MVAFSIFIGSALYFAKLWLQTKRKYSFLLFFALGFGSSLLFKVPNLLKNLGIPIHQQDFYFYFLVTLFLYLLSYYFFIKGLQSLHHKIWRWHTNIIFMLMSCFLILYLSVSFFVDGMNPILPVWVSHIIFFIPAQFYFFVMLYKLIKTEIGENDKIKNELSQPTFFLMVGIYLLFTTSIAYIIVQTGSFSDRFWFLNVASSWGITVIQCLAGMALFLGLRSFAKTQLKETK